MQSIKGLRWWLLLAVLVIAGGFGYHYWSQRNAAPEYKTVKLEKGPITASVAASGTLNPVVSVLVGSQVSGQLQDILVDFNSDVTQGQLLARIDPQTFEYKVRQAQADLDAARAQVLTQQANLAAQRSDVTRNQVAVADAQLTLDRKQQLVDKGFISTAERDTARTALHSANAQTATARAQVAVASANLTSAQATVRQRSAVLEQANIDLGRTAIKAPVAGVVIKRSVDKGQTVAASLQSPELFIIAGDLADMRVDTAIDESEIGRIRKGQKASFTVDAFPGRTFDGEVLEIRKAAQNVSNVVTYMVEVSASNPKKELLPGMTANVKIITDSRDNILKVSNAALRFKPAGVASAPAVPATAPTGAAGRTAAGAASAGQQRAGAFGEGRGHRARTSGRLYTLDPNGQPVELTVRLGLTDGSVTEVSGANLKEGMDIITGLAPTSGAARGGAGAGTSSPARSGPRMF